MTEKEKIRIQTSETFLLSAILALSGGFQDAYTYNVRNEVFSNAQTGNVVLMSQNFMTGKWEAGLKYLFPLFAFALGVLIAEQIQHKYKYAKRLHWRQGILGAEIIILFIVGFIPQRGNIFESLKPITGQYPLVFIGRNDRTKPISKESVNQVIELLGYKGRLTGHGFRHTMSTILHEQGFNSAWIETQLAHVDKNAIRGTYNHAQYLEGRREMMQWYGDFIDELRMREAVLNRHVVG